MTVQQAFGNVINVVSNAHMTGPEHDALKDSIKLIAERCKVADELEQCDQEAKKEANQDEKSN